MGQTALSIRKFTGLWILMYFLPAVFGLVVYSTLFQIRSLNAGGFMMPNLIFHHCTLTLALEIVAHIKQLMATLWRQRTSFNSRAIANKVLIIVAPTLSAMASCPF